MRSLIIMVFLFILIISTALPTYGDELEDISRQLDTVRKILEESRKASRPLEENLQKAENSLRVINGQMGVFEKDIVRKEQEIALGESDLLHQKRIIDERARKYYKTSRLYLNNLLGLFLSRGLSEATRVYYVHQQGVQRDRTQLLKIAFFIRTLEEKKAKLVLDTKQLESLKTAVNKERTYFDAEVVKVRGYQQALQQQIAQLSSKQQQLIAQKLASLNIPQSAYSAVGGCSSDLTNGKDPGFSPRIGFFTFGVPNRVGLNQYGAKGRAEAGQSYETILKAYYNADITTGYNTGINIHVTGSNEYGQSFDDNWNIEDYAKHIYEVPTNWPKETLKAQAIAARSYALAYTNNGSGSICPSQQCQVVKREENDSNWQQAVKDTEGIVLTNGGAPIKAWFSSTHGGYVLSSSDIGWSSTAWTKTGQDINGSIGNFSDLMNTAYDKNSPWFYCNWGSRSDYGKTAWLKEEEVADIANIILLAKIDSGTREHLYQVDKPNPAGTDTWDRERVKQELKNKGTTPLSRAQTVSIEWDKNNGKTTQITISGEGGSASFEGSEFKNFFNVRAPANIQIVGPLYNVEIR